MSLSAVIPSAASPARFVWNGPPLPKDRFIGDELPPRVIKASADETVDAPILGRARTGLQAFG